MSFFDQTITRYADSANLDAFARLRTSSPTTLFDSKQLYDSGSCNWSTEIVGNATASYVQYQASVHMISSGSNSRIVRQSKRRFNYQPGKSHAIVTTTNLKETNSDHSDVIKRVGYFDENNGIYFTYSGSQMGVGLRSKSTGNVVDTFYSQSQWNLDTFDGSGSSGNILDISKSQIFFFDLEWLGVGRIRYGIFQGGNPYYVHEISNTNALTGDKLVYMSTPNLPIRFELINSGSVPVIMHHICSSVISEGGADITGPLRAVDLPTNTHIVVGANTTTAIIGIRLKQSHLSSTVKPNTISVLNISGQGNFKYTLAMNPTVNETLSWIDVPDSAVQYTTGSEGATISNEGNKIISGYVSTTADNVAVPFADVLALGSEIDGTPDEMILYVTNINVSAQNFCASIGYQETI